MKLAAVRRIALSLPEANEEPHFNYASFRVRGKIFVTVPLNEEHIHVFVAEPAREQALALYPQCVEKLLWGSKVVGLRITLATAPVAVVDMLIRQAWSYKAPKALLAAGPTQ